MQKSPDWFACPFDIGRETGFWDLASRCQPFALFINLVSWQAAAAATLSAWSRWIFHPDGMPTLRFGRFPRRQLGQLPIGRPGTFLSFAQCRQGPDFNTHTHTTQANSKKSVDQTSFRNQFCWCLGVSIVYAFSVVIIYLFECVCAVFFVLFLFIFFADDGYVFLCIISVLP